MPRTLALLSTIVFTSTALATVQCSSFTEEPSSSATADASTSDRHDGPTTREGFCEALLKSGAAPVLCDDFSTGELGKAWHRGTLETVGLLVARTGTVELGKGSDGSDALLASTGPSPTPDGTVMLYTLNALNGIRLEFDIEVLDVPTGSGTVTAVFLDVADTRIRLKAKTEGSVDLTMNVQGVTNELPEQLMNVPLFAKNRRHVKIELFGADATQRLIVAVDGRPVLDRAVSDPFPTFPTTKPVRLELGNHRCSEAPFRVLIDNVILDDRP